MLASSFPIQHDFINALGEHLRSLHKPFEGAHFRIAFAREGGLRFLTGCVLFQEHHTPERGQRNYGSIVFVEEWVPDQWEAHSRLSRLVSGQERIGGHEIKHVFPSSTASRDFYYGIGGSPTWRITSTIQRDASWKDFYPSQASVLAYGLKPYTTLAHAVNEWVFGIDNSLYLGTSLQNQWSLVTCLPDLRVKIPSAEWVPGILHLELDVHIPLDQIQLQIIHAGSSKGHQLLGVKNGEQQIEVPEDAKKLYIFLVDRTGDCAAQLILNSLYEAHGKAKSVAQGLQQAGIDLAGGEKDNVEFKPFMESKSSKEFEFVETVIAFANTYGGRIYVGVRDDGTPQGEVTACKTLKGSIDQVLLSQISRLKELVREKIKPVPTVDINQIRIGAEPIVVAEVQRGNNLLCATHENKILVRKGATNRVPDPMELRALVSEVSL